MKFECFSHWQHLPASVDSLFSQGEGQSIFLTREWFESLYVNAYKDDQSLLLACVTDESRVLALLPLIGDSNENLQSFSHRYTAFYSLIVLDIDQAAIFDCLAEGLSQMPVHSLLLKPVDEDDENLLRLQRSLAASGYESQRHFYFYNWIHRTDRQTFDEYMADRPARLRNTIARKRRKLEREHGFEIRMFRNETVQQGLTDYHAAYSASWKANEQYVTLLDAAATNLAKKDWTRLAVLYIDGSAAASQLWFVVRGKASIFRLAYDEKWSNYSPGSILTAYLMHYVIDDDNVEEIDFLTGNESYKQDWMTERRQRYRQLFIKHHKSGSDSGILTSIREKMTKFLLDR